jgi:hypothetical protein
MKKLLALCIGVCMLLSSMTVFGFDYTDVASTNSYYKAIKVISNLEIAKGDDQGNFNPTSEVKRSEMIAFICRMMGEENATTSNINVFTDVTANHWAAGYIAWGVNRGIINGMGDGTFAPDASVSYQDAVVMIMRALGYDRIAKRAENGGYPTGYLKLASQYGVLKDASYDNAKAATREIIAQLIYNALTAPLVDVSYYGVSVDDDRYVIYNGKNGQDLRTLLTYSNEIIKVKAEITKTPKSNPSACIDKQGNYMVEIDLKDAYDYSLASVAAEIGADPAIVYVGETEAADLLGSTVEAYLVDDEELGDWTLLAVIGDNRSVVEETISENLNTMTVSDNVISYYADLNDRKMTKIDIVDAPTVYYNGMALTSTELTNAFGTLQALLRTASSVKFVGAKNTAYDKIFVTEYIYKVVKSVNANEKLIKFDPAGALDLDAESRNNEDFIYGIYDAAGKAMDIADIEVGDVLNIVCPIDGTTGNIDTVDYLDIYVTNETVTGKVDELKQTIGKYVIDGDAYAPNVSLTIGEEGIFYLTIDDKIIKKDATSTVTKNFALLLDAERDTAFGEDEYTLRVITADGIKDLVVASTVKYINGAASTITYKSESGGQRSLFDTIFGAAIADETTEAAAQAKLADRFFTYKTNSLNQITEIRMAGSTGAPIAAITKSAAKWNPDFEEFGGESIGEAKLFSAPMENKDTTDSAPAWNINVDKVALVDFASLDEDDTFAATLYMLDGEKELAAVLMADKPSLGIETSPLAVIQAIGSKLDADENTVTSYTVVIGGEVKTVVANYDEYPSGLGYEVGDIFQYAVNANDEIVEAAIIYDASARALQSYATNLTVNNDDMAFVFGVITEYADYMVLATDVGSDFIADNFTKFKIAEVEGATYAWYEEGANNPVKKITINGIRETVRANAVYAAVAVVNENERIEDIVVIALNPADFADYTDINNFADWKISIN